MFDYGHCHRSAFCERQCNFRLALMYFKSFFFPHCDIPLPRVTTMKGHVDVVLKVEIALAQAVAQILEPCAH